MTPLRFYACSTCKQVWRRSDWKWTSFFFTTQGHVTPKWLIRSGHNSNLSEILCQSLLPVSLMEIEFRVTKKRWIHHFLHYKPMGNQIQHSRANKSKVNNPFRPKFELIRAFMPVQFDKYLIKGDWETTDINVFTTQGHVTPMWLVRSGRNSNPSNISYLSLLPVCLMKIEFIVADKKWRHYLLHNKSMGKKIRAQGRNTPKWIIRSGQNSNSLLQVWQRSNQRWLRKAGYIIFFHRSRARNSKMTDQIRLKFYACPRFLSWWRLILRLGKDGDIIFPMGMLKGE